MDALEEARKQLVPVIKKLKEAAMTGGSFTLNDDEGTVWRVEFTAQ
jgi:hypothetical protein